MRGSILLLVAVVQLVGCSQDVSFSKSQSSKTGADELELNPPAAQVQVGANVTLTASGGVPPYVFANHGVGSLTVNSGGDSVRFTSNQTGTVRVVVTDSRGEDAVSEVVVSTVGSQTGSIQGLVTNSVNGQPLSGVQVTVRSGTTTVTSVFTDQTGSYTVPGLAAGSYRLQFQRSGFIPIANVPAAVAAGAVTVVNQSMSAVLTSQQIRIVLTWTIRKAGAVRDVDSYLAVPGRSLPVSWVNMDSGQGEQLDIDDVNWVGPETITISNIRQGTYTYYVNNYSHRAVSTALGNSSVHVDVYQGSQQIKSYNVPPGQGLTYELFRIVNGNIVDVRTYNDSLLVH